AVQQADQETAVLAGPGHPDPRRDELGRETHQGRQAPDPRGDRPMTRAGRGLRRPPADRAGAAGRDASHGAMSRRLPAGTARDLVRAERDIRGRIGDQPLDFAAMAAVSNIYRAANVVRNHMERQVLVDGHLSWAAFTVLFVLWIWGDQQTRHLAEEAGVTKGTLTGVLKTLEKRGLARGRGNDADGRLVLVSLEPKGQDVIERLFPAFNRGEAQVSAGLTGPANGQLASHLRNT